MPELVHTVFQPLTNDDPSELKHYIASQLPVDRIVQDHTGKKWIVIDHEGENMFQAYNGPNAPHDIDLTNCTLSGPSPRGLGFCAPDFPLGTVRIGKDKGEWIVALARKKHIWKKIQNVSDDEYAELIEKYHTTSNNNVEFLREVQGNPKKPEGLKIKKEKKVKQEQLKIQDVGLHNENGVQSVISQDPNDKKTLIKTELPNADTQKEGTTKTISGTTVVVKQENGKQWVDESQATEEFGEYWTKLNQLNGQPPVTQTTPQNVDIKTEVKEQPVNDDFSMMPALEDIRREQSMCQEYKNEIEKLELRLNNRDSSINKQLNDFNNLRERIVTCSSELKRVLNTQAQTLEKQRTECRNEKTRVLTKVQEMIESIQEIENQSVEDRKLKIAQQIETIRNKTKSPNLTAGRIQELENEIKKLQEQSDKITPSKYFSMMRKALEVREMLEDTPSNVADVKRFEDEYNQTQLEMPKSVNIPKLRREMFRDLTVKYGKSDFEAVIEMDPYDLLFKHILTSPIDLTPKIYATVADFDKAARETIDAITPEEWENIDLEVVFARLKVAMLEYYCIAKHRISNEDDFERELHNQVFREDNESRYLDMLSINLDQFRTFLKAEFDDYIKNQSN